MEISRCVCRIRVSLHRIPCGVGNWSSVTDLAVMHYGCILGVMEYSQSDSLNLKVEAKLPWI